MIKKLFLILPFMSICACSINIKKISDDTNIQNALSNIKKSDKKELLNFLSKYPATISYNPDRDIKCTKIVTGNREKIMIPILYTNSVDMTELSVLKGLYIYTTTKKYKLNNFFYELEQLARYTQVEYLLSHTSTDTIKNNNLIKREMIDDICAYVTSSRTFDEKINDDTSKKEKSCGYPLDNLDSLKKYYSNLRESLSSIDSDDYFNLYYEKQMERAKRGEITREDAEKNYYYLFSEPQQGLYREQRKNTYDNIYSIDRFESFYRKEIKKLRENQNRYKDLIQYFPECLK